MGKVVFLFPGQGSQKTLMGLDLYNNNELYKSMIDEANTFNPLLKEVLFNENDDRINDTMYSQLAIFSNQMGILSVIKERYNVADSAYAGFSLGEYSALCAGGCFDYKTGLEILNKRAVHMSKNKDGCMYAVLGKTQDELKDIISKINNSNNTNIQIANLNTESQQVLAGLESDFDKVLEEIESQIKRVIKLNVSGAFHTSYFTNTADEFVEDISNVSLGEIKNVYSNVTADLISSIDLEYIKTHMITGVRFYDQTVKMIADGYDTFVEIGEVSVLGAMIKKADRSLNIIHISNLEDIEKLEGVL